MMEKDYSQDLIREVWEKAKAAEGVDKNVYRMDDCGAWIQWEMHNNKKSRLGWTIENISSSDSGDPSNLIPLHWKNNFDKAAKRLRCNVIAHEDQNIYGDEKLLIVIDDDTKKKLMTLPRERLSLTQFILSKVLYYANIPFFFVAGVGIATAVLSIYKADVHAYATGQFNMKVWFAILSISGLAGAIGGIIQYYRFRYLARVLTLGNLFELLLSSLISSTNLQDVYTVWGRYGKPFISRVNDSPQPERLLAKVIALYAMAKHPSVKKKEMATAALTAIDQLPKSYKSMLTIIDAIDYCEQIIATQR